MSVKEYEFHPYAAVVPMLGPPDLNALAADIQGNGLRQPIVLFEGKILDGRNRYKACQIVGVEPEFRDFNGDGDPLDFIVSMNLVRRQLTASQKALAVAKIAELPRGNPALQNQKSPANPKSAQMPNRKTVAEVASEVEVSPRTVGQAKQVLREAPKETVEQIERGEKSVATAVKEIKEAKKNTPKEDKTEKPKRLDETGYAIPEPLLADWDRALALKETVNQITHVKSVFKEGLDNGDVVFAEVTNTVLATLTNAFNDLKRVLPYAVCTTCQGRTPKKCTTCKGRGFLSKFYYQTCIPKEDREMRAKVVSK